MAEFDDVTSLSQLNDLSSEVKWLWVDIFNPDEKESEIISELLGNEPTMVDDIKKERITLQEYIQDRIQELRCYVIH